MHISQLLKVPSMFRFSSVKFSDMSLPTTKHYLDIAEIKEDVVVLKDGTVRAVIMVSSVNFALKNEDEQNALVGAYVGFLNSLQFPLQIIIQSRKLDIDGYLASLREIAAAQTNELLKTQTKEYIEYIAELVEMGDIMTKRFYIAVPYDPLTDRTRSYFTRLGSALSPAGVVKLKQEKFLKYKRELMQRVNNVVSGLASVGLTSTPLDTQSLIELFYNAYNPEVAKQQKLADVEKLRIEE